MEFKIDATKIRSLRASRAWSQEHLAHVAGIGRRTIQRAESTGKSSFETAQAIASALQVQVGELVDQELVKSEAIIERNSLLRKIWITSSSLLFLILFSLSRVVTADQVKLDIQAIVNDEHETVASVTNEEGSDSQIQLAGNYRITVTPTITNQGNVQLDIQLLKQIGDEYEQIAKPVLHTPDGETAMIKSATDDGKRLTLEITPRIIQ